MIVLLNNTNIQNIFRISLLSIACFCVIVLYENSNIDWRGWMTSSIGNANYQPLFVLQEAACYLVDLGPNYNTSGCVGQVMVSECSITCVSGYFGSPTVECLRHGGQFSVIGSCEGQPCEFYSCPAPMTLRGDVASVGCANGKNCKTGECCSFPTTLTSDDIRAQYQSLTGISTNTQLNNLGDSAISSLAQKIRNFGTTSLRTDSFAYLLVDPTTLNGNATLQRVNSNNLARIVYLGGDAAVVKSTSFDSASAELGTTLPQSVAGVTGSPRWSSDLITITRFQNGKVMSSDGTPISIEFPCVSFLAMGVCRFATGSSPLTCDQNLQIFNSRSNPGFCTIQSQSTSSFITFQRPFSEKCLCGEFLNEPDFGWTIGGPGLIQTLFVNASCPNNVAGGLSSPDLAIAVASGSVVDFINISPDSKIFRVFGSFTFQPSTAFTARFQENVKWEKLHHIPLILSKTEASACKLPNVLTIVNCPSNFRCGWEMNAGSMDGVPICSLAVNVVSQAWGFVSNFFYTIKLYTECAKYKESDFYEAIHYNMSVPYYALEIYPAVCGGKYTFQMLRCRGVTSAEADAACERICSEAVHAGSLVNRQVFGTEYFQDPQFVNIVQPSKPNNAGLFALFALVALPIFLLIVFCFFRQSKQAAKDKPSKADGMLKSPVQTPVVATPPSNGRTIPNPYYLPPPATTTTTILPPPYHPSVPNNGLYHPNPSHFPSPANTPVFYTPAYGHPPSRVSPLTASLEGQTPSPSPQGGTPVAEEDNQTEMGGLCRA